MKKKDLKEFNEIIQICSVCGKIDTYKNDGHDCDEEIYRQSNEDNLWK